jgi:hypothetical protein
MTDNTGSEQAPHIRLALPRKHHGIVIQAIQHWRQSGIIDEQTALNLSESLVLAPFDWLKAARYAFILSLSCVALTVVSLLASHQLMRIFWRLFHQSIVMNVFITGAISAAIFRYGRFLRRKPGHRTIGVELVFLVAAMFLYVSVNFLGIAILPGGLEHRTFPFVVATLVYALLGLWLPSKLVWVLGLLSLGAWIGVATGGTNDFASTFLGMHYPIRFAVLGAVLSLLGIVGEQAFQPQERGIALKNPLWAMSPQTKVFGLLVLFIALWILSILGNFGVLLPWGNVNQGSLFHWTLLLVAASVAAIWFGLKHEDNVLRGFGMASLLVNLYTRYFEYFWHTFNRALFFAVLAASFWFLGSRAQAIWALGTEKVQHRSRDDGPTEPSTHDDGETT